MSNTGGSGEDSVESDQEFSHAGNEGDLLGFALSLQVLVIIADNRVVIDNRAIIAVPESASLALMGGGLLMFDRKPA